ncbi:hypothetical protein [Corynebacterium urinipleomorphum]|uniref:hypothetical protein n=1 Tax=Corynebacterium urinipleomorphum TaxID=1852380 RepID=UPI000B34AEFE|nr:hypothetical protein [Corynebacterium urinipleomorphum]
MSRREVTAGVVIIAVAVLTGVLAAGISWLGAATAFEPVPRGDQLGQETGEDFNDYAARATDSLAAAPAEVPVYALLTFTGVLSSAQASEALGSINRVSAVIPDGSAAQPVGEPKASRDRSEQFRFAAGDRIAGAVVRDTGDVLRVVAQDPLIAAAETLPPDAVWGAFGVRQVEVLPR